MNTKIYVSFYFYECIAIRKICKIKRLVINSRYMVVKLRTKAMITCNSYIQNFFTMIKSLTFCLNISEDLNFMNLATISGKFTEFMYLKIPSTVCSHCCYH